MACQALDHRYERPGNRQVQTGEAEVTRQWLVLPQRVETGVHAQLAEALASEIQPRIDAARRQGTVQAQRLVREIDPAPIVSHPQRAATGIDTHGALGAAGRNVQIDVSVEQPLPGKILRQPLGQAVQRELLEVITQARLWCQALILATQAGLSGAPAVGTEVQLAAGQAL
ncbi:hypothetical protein D3C81_1205160 [compost metagenome]